MRTSSAHLSRALKRSTFVPSPSLRTPILPTTRTSHRLPLQTQLRTLTNTSHRSQESASTSPDPSTTSAPPNTTSRESLTPQTHYDLFPSLGAHAIPPTGPFTLDLKLLKREFLQLQGAAHPDRAPSNKKRQAEGASARINNAYKTLQSPLLRAQYILSLRGIDVAEDETARVEDPELLMEVLETREVIEEAGSEADLVPLKEANERRVEGSVGVLEEAFARDDLAAAKAEAVKLRYWINIRESIEGWEQGKPVVLVH